MRNAAKRKTGGPSSHRYCGMAWMDGAMRNTMPKIFDPYPYEQTAHTYLSEKGNPHNEINKKKNK